MNNNELSARLQHAVEHITDNTQHPANSSKPLNGEIVFSTDRTNFRVGDGVINGDTIIGTQYSNLPNIIPHGFYSGTAVSSTTSDIPTISNYKIKIGDYYLNISDYHLYSCISTVSDSGATRWQDLGTLKGDDGQDLTVKPYYNVASNDTPKTLQGHLSDVGNLSSKNGIYIPANTLLTDNSAQTVQSGYLGCYIPNDALSTMSLGQSFEIVIKGQLPIIPGTSSNYHTLYYMINLYNINSKSWFTHGNYMCLDRAANASYFITNVLRIVRIDTNLYSVIFLIGDPDS